MKSKIVEAHGIKMHYSSNIGILNGTFYVGEFGVYDGRGTIYKPIPYPPNYRGYTIFPAISQYIANCVILEDGEIGDKIHFYEIFPILLELPQIERDFDTIDLTGVSE